MPNFKQVDLSGVKTISINKRKSKVQLKDFAKVFNPTTQSFSDFVRSLPHFLVAEDLRKFVDDVARAHKRKKPVIVLIGAHVIKVGLSPLLVELLRTNVVTCVGMNSAAAIHDVETAMWGKTSEDVEENLADGTFGMSKETGEFINTMLVNAMRAGNAGYGEVLGKALQRAPNKNVSILATCYTLDVPVTVHAAIGTDIVHQQPTMNGAATGELSFRDFKVLCNVVKDLRGGGVVMNIGSAVVLPEVFLKALTVARNLGAPAKGFTTANFDMIQHYRPRMNIIHRPTRNGGRGYMFTGHHEIMIPLVCAMIKERLRTL
ncbi:MAG: hypothetical protein HY277_04850 [Ignavibacteriales bacterium]|nr:hypothetical protein [Ignavibacteriales bacterium]